MPGRHVHNLSVHSSSQSCQGLLTQRLCADLLLHKTCSRWQRLLEEFQSIVAVEDLDGLGQSHKLLLAHSLDLCPLLFLLVASSCQLQQTFCLQQVTAPCPRDHSPFRLSLRPNHLCESAPTLSVLSKHQPPWSSLQ